MKVQRIAFKKTVYEDVEINIQALNINRIVIEHLVTKNF